MAERIQELGRTGRKDPRREENWKEAMQVLAEVKEEYGEKGLGLTFVYAVGMRVCLDFGHPEEVLRLFQEVHTCEREGLGLLDVPVISVQQYTSK